MEPGKLRQWVIVCSLIVIVPSLAFGGVGTLMLVQFWNGSFDPVLSDGLDPEQVPAFKKRLIVITTTAIVLFVAGSTAFVMALRNERRANQPPI